MTGQAMSPIPGCVLGDAALRPDKAPQYLRLANEQRDSLTAPASNLIGCSILTAN